jgi:hypothetical protein
MRRLVKAAALLLAGCLLVFTVLTYRGISEAEEAVTNERLADARFEQGVEAFDKNECDTAIARLSESIALYRKVLVTQSRQVGRILKLSRSSRSARIYIDQLMPAFEEYQRVESKLDQARMHRGLAYSRKGEWPNALADLNVTEELFTRPELYEERARVREQLGDRIGARVDEFNTQQLRERAADKRSKADQSLKWLESR